MTRSEIKVRVPTPSLDVGVADLVATVTYPPDGMTDGSRVLICWPGGSYTRSYWDFPRATYNFSEAMSSRGHMVISVDPLGVGDSGRPPKGDDVGIEVMAAAAAEFTDHVRVMIANGTLVDGVGPLNQVRFLGVGHSMGSILVTAQQSRFASYDALAILGFAVSFRDTRDDGDTDSMSVSDLMQSAAAEHVRSGSGLTWDDEYVMLDRGLMRGAFHLPDVPFDVIDADDALAVRWPRRPIVEAAAGFDSQYASEIEVPIFLGLGAIDLTSDPKAEVQNYTSCDDITIVVLRNSAHCHNFSADRHLLWDRIIAWL